MWRRRRPTPRGYYQFINLEPDVYGVHELQPAGYFQGGQQAGSRGGDDHVADYITAVTIGGGEHLTDYNFSELPPASLAGYVFQDGPTLRDERRLCRRITSRSIRDGLRTADDRPIAGVVMELRDGPTGVPITGRPSLAGRVRRGPDPGRDRRERLLSVSSACRPAATPCMKCIPAGYTDYLDTPGTTGGIAFNV